MVVEKFQIPGVQITESVHFYSCSPSKTLVPNKWTQGLYWSCFVFQKDFVNKIKFFQCHCWYENAFVKISNWSLKCVAYKCNNYNVTQKKWQILLQKTLSKGKHLNKQTAQNFEDWTINIKHHTPSHPWIISGK